MQVKQIILGTLYLLWVATSVVTAQTTKESNIKKSITIEGVVYDQATRKPLAYANVALANNQIGTITNATGKFRLLIPARYQQGTVKLSYIGYKTVSYKVSKMRSQKAFWLPEDPRMLAEVTIQGLKTSTILKKAIKKIPDNYYQKPYTSDGFYRATVLKDNQEYIAIGEGSLEVHQTRPARKNQVRLKKLRSSENKFFNEWLGIGLSTTSLLDFDIVNRSKRLGILNKKGLKNHVFQVKKVMPYEDSEVYVITFHKKEGVKEIGYQGELWIDTKSFAFVYIDTAMDTKNTKGYKVKLDRVIRLHFRYLGISFKLLKKRFRYRYKKINHTYYLQQASYDAMEHCERLGMYDFKRNIKVDYLVTAYHPEQTQPFSQKEVAKSRRWQQNQATFFKDIAPGYWDAYNILLPEIAYVDIATKIEAANKAREAKEQEKESSPKKEK